MNSKTAMLHTITTMVENPRVQNPFDGDFARFRAVLYMHLALTKQDLSEEEIVTDVVRFFGVREELARANLAEVKRRN